MYKDKAKQKEANRQASQRQRDKKGMTDDCVKAGIVIPDHPVPVIPEHTAQGNIRVSKPGDSDYEPQCETTRAFVDNRDKRPSPIKEVNSFNDLPPDVQNTIESMSVNDEGVIDQTIKANRTAIAVHYQHLFPNRYNSTGVG